MCLLAISVKNNRPEVVKLAKNSGFHKNIFKIYKKPYPFEFWGGWGLLVFHKYLLVMFRKIWKCTAIQHIQL